ncbi:hypothetical protein CPB83DRAFT_850215 [Crepidotus variabilis]|uniref:F-box domain-containing protein n=1 Tax=Crepidotus variabilis TaxID=179855 RepID=A0A9P6JSG4_9AGAR|nr:hypothetical protein CPB83DRAFT_850215 [Crepidotus variabilis]
MISVLPKLLANLCDPCRISLSAALSELQELESESEPKHPPPLERTNVVSSEKEQAVPPLKRTRNLSFFRSFVSSRSHSPGINNQRSQVPNRITTSNYDHNLQLSFNRLPVELLLDIFVHICHSDYDKYLWDKERFKKTTPLTLGGVCGYWRNTVWRYPPLWSHVYLFLSEKRYTRQMKILDFWLERSGNQPLLLNISLVKEEAWDAKRIPDSMIDILLKHSTRWRAISWVLPEAWYPHLNQIRPKLDNLYSICTQPTYKDADQSPTLRERLIFLDSAPKLEKVHLNGYYLTDVPLQWIQLTHLTLQQVYIDECYYAFHRSPNLARCKISKLLVNDVNRTVECPSSQIHMEKMKKFILHASSWKDAVELLGHVSLPAVETLDLSGSQGDATFEQLSKAILSAIGDLKVGCNGDMIVASSTLTSLALRDANLDFKSDSSTDTELKSLLLQLPSLETLDIKVTNRSGERTMFCMWWFIELLKAHPLNSVRDNNSPSSAPSSSEQVQVPAPTEELPPTPKPDDVAFHLPNLRHFVFEVPEILTHSFKSHHCALDGLDCDITDRRFMEALLELLKQRSYRGSLFRRRIVDEDASAANLPLRGRLKEFCLKSDGFLTVIESPSTESIPEMVRKTWKNFEQLKTDDFSFKLEMGDCRWNISS